MKRRQELGLTQADISQLSKISVAFIQLLESGKGNPSLKTAEALMSCLDLELKIIEREPAWEDLPKVGVAIHPYSQKIEWHGKKSEALIRRAYRFCRIHEAYERERVALEAYLMALRDHYPLQFREFADMKEFLPDVPGPRHIKLRRISLAQLSKIF